MEFQTELALFHKTKKDLWITHHKKYGENVSVLFYNQEFSGVYPTLEDAVTAGMKLYKKTKKTFFVKQLNEKGVEYTCPAP